MYDCDSDGGHYYYRKAMMIKTMMAMLAVTLKMLSTLINGDKKMMPITATTMMTIGDHDYDGSDHE